MKAHSIPFDDYAFFVSIVDATKKAYYIGNRVEKSVTVSVADVEVKMIKSSRHIQAIYVNTLKLVVSTGKLYLSYLVEGSALSGLTNSGGKTVNANDDTRKFQTVGK
ncbi:hypothetical protein [Bacillus thuringiensis]|uniref:hypothetical protein n=1 Tax=Bacillus thuringiensis TaxID=1428 RepID=UPI002AB51AA0|nr:hypothetical protein [Bacillus thuringiensis]MDY8166255.1 hypothetical protein [Bacillus thuringiensis]